MVVTCDIEFDENKANCYFAGQLVSGTIVLKCDKVKDVQAIQLQITGYSEVQWSEKTGFNSHYTYQGREEYLCCNTYLMGSENMELDNVLPQRFNQQKMCSQGSKNIIAVGVRTYTFACQLPQNCPSSFEGKHGFIRYTVKVNLLRPWKHDQTYIKAFTVLRLTDLNFEPPQIRIPSHSETYRTLCCAPCTTQPLKVELKIPQAGYVPGQCIPVQALIINNTNIAVSAVDFTLIMIVRYISENPRHQHVERLSVSKVRNDGVLKYCTRSLRDEIHIPPTPPTCLQTCSLIQITYQVEMEVKMKCFQKSQLVVIPVIIGNVPLANNTSGVAVIQQQPTVRNGCMFADPEFSKYISSAPNLDIITPNMLPHIYEESYHALRKNIAENEQNKFGVCEFTPLYTVYKIPSPTFEEPIKSLGILNNSFQP